MFTVFWDRKEVISWHLDKPSTLTATSKMLTKLKAPWRIALGQYKPVTGNQDFIIISGRYFKFATNYSSMINGSVI